MQETINGYAAEVPEVTSFGTFIRATPSTEEIQSAMQAKAQYD
jgi:hypothetical protein